MDRRYILLAEDEMSIGSLISMNLEDEGYRVCWVKNGVEAVKQFEHNKFNLAILDVMLPGMDGFEVCRKIKSVDKMVPVLFLTAKNSGADRIHGLKIGGDDYLGKPFELEELLLRVEKLIGRKEESNTAKDTFEFGKNKIDFSGFTAVNLRGETIKLSQKENAMLKFFSEHQNVVISREELLDTVWGEGAYPTSRTIDNFILAFRKHFEENPREPRHFFSIRSVGYKFVL